MDNFNLKKYLAEGKLNEEKNPKPYEVFSDEELDFATDSIVALHKKLNPGLDNNKTKNLINNNEA